MIREKEGDGGKESDVPRKWRQNEMKEKEILRAAGKTNLVGGRKRAELAWLLCDVQH